MSNRNSAKVAYSKFIHGQGCKRYISVAQNIQNFKVRCQYEISQILKQRGTEIISTLMNCTNWNSKRMNMKKGRQIQKSCKGFLLSHHYTVIAQPFLFVFHYVCLLNHLIFSWLCMVWWMVCIQQPHLQVLHPAVHQQSSGRGEVPWEWGLTGKHQHAGGGRLHHQQRAQEKNAQCLHRSNGWRDRWTILILRFCVLSHCPYIR